MTWNYRLVRYRDGKGYGLHEVYYDEQGLPCTMSFNPCSFACDAEEGVNAVLNSLCMALNDVTTREVLDEPEKWPVPLQIRDE